LSLVESGFGDASVRRERIDAVRLPSSYAIAKRAFDLVVGILLFTFSLPLFVLLAILIRLDSPGPIVFRQVRVGLGGRPFHFYKFRTMYTDARERYPDLYAYRYDNEAIKTMRFKLLDDPRLTPLGQRLRRTSLDELPNLWNVLKGDISLVGPRPEIPQMLEYYSESQLQKFAVKPGVTGLAQIGGRGLLSFQDTIAEDLRYVATCRFWRDLWIIARTAIEVVRRQGAF
jgi:lipopolysaccharide/colanic/teichoic acid biosynthesis glycosyltransferase